MGGVISIETKTNPEKEHFTVGMANGKFKTWRNGETNIFLSDPETFLASQDARKASQKILCKLVKILQDAYSIKTIHLPSQ